MEKVAIILVLFGVVCMAGNSVLAKWLINKKAFTDRELLITKNGLGGALCLLWFLSPLNTMLNSWAPGREVTVIFWIAVIGVILPNIAMQYANVRAQRFGDASLVAPIQALTPGLITLTAMTLGEYPSTLGYAGIALVAGGTYLHAREEVPVFSKEFLRPFYFWNSSLEINKRTALRWAYLSAICGTIGLLFDGLMSRHGDVAFGVTIELTALALVFTFPVFAKGSKQGTASGGFRERFWRFCPQITSLGIIHAAIFISITTAFRLAPIAYIGSIKRLSIFLTVVFAVWFLGEKKSAKRRVLLASVITTGAMLIMFDPTQAVVVDSADELIKKIFG